MPFPAEESVFVPLGEHAGRGGIGDFVTRFEAEDCGRAAEERLDFAPDGVVGSALAGVEGADGPPNEERAFVALDAVGRISREVEGDGDPASLRLGEAVEEGDPVAVGETTPAARDFARDDAVGVIAL